MINASRSSTLSMKRRARYWIVTPRRRPKRALRRLAVTCLPVTSIEIDPTVLSFVLCCARQGVEGSGHARNLA